MSESARCPVTSLQGCRASQRLSDKARAWARSGTHIGRRSGAVELLAPWAASDARRTLPAPRAGTNRGAVKRYCVFVLRPSPPLGVGISSVYPPPEGFVEVNVVRPQECSALSKNMPGVYFISS